MHMQNVGTSKLTLLLIEQGRIVLHEGDCVTLAQDHRGQFTRVTRIDGPKKIRRRLVRQLRRGERKRG